MSTRPDRSPALRWLRLWAPVAGDVLAIFIVSGSPKPPSLPHGVTDKHGHAAAYAGLAAITLRALAGGAWQGVTFGRAAGAAALSAAYGASDEIHQHFVPGRTADPADLGADAAGAALGAAVAWAFARARTGSRRRDRI